MCNCEHKSECRCRMREASRNKIDELIAILSNDLPYHEFEAVKSQILRELDTYESYAKEGCSHE